MDFLEINAWTGQQVAKWLTKNDMMENVESFIENAITGSEFVDLTEKDLDTLGVKKLGSRKRILKVITEYNMQLGNCNSASSSSSKNTVIEEGMLQIISLVFLCLKLC